MSKSNDSTAVRPGDARPVSGAGARSPDQAMELPAEALEHLPAEALPPGVRITGCPYDPTCSIPGSWHFPEDAKDIEP